MTLRSIGIKGFRRGLVSATAVSTVFIASAAQAQPEFSDESPHIIVNNAINPNASGPGGALDLGVNGVGQMIALIQTGPTSAGLSLCSGSLINPRTVIFAAHCVNTRPASAYGSETGAAPNSGPFGTLPGVPLSFGFEATNRCTGANGCTTGTGPYERWRDNGFSTQTSSHIYNVNQVWYDTRSLEPNAIGFLYADIAMATLDTHASDIPTWSMLFSPLEGQTHAINMGYGVNGTSASAQGPAPGCTTASPCGSIDYRRRAAENIISLLGSLDDIDNTLFPSYGPFTTNPQNLYIMDFDSPGQSNQFDFDIFNGAALPREGTTAGGDSGGPLIVDQEFATPVIAGVLSGGSRYFGAQRFSTYGTTSFYQPLFLYWEEIVANNPYVYAASRPGNRNWENPAHWVQELDPAYQILVNGQLANGLPNFESDGPAGNGPKFGEICDGVTCTDISSQGSPLPDAGTVYVPGGPGTTNFVPNNIEPVNSTTPGQTVKARYFDVTLGSVGRTRLNSEVTIDRLTVDNPNATLDVRPAGILNVWAEYNQFTGSTIVDGQINSGEAFILSGLLSGEGTFNPTFLTVVAGGIAPRTDGTTGTLTVQGDLILSSAAVLGVDLSRNNNDLLRVTADADNAGVAALGGLVVFGRGQGNAPRHGQTFTFLTAEGGVDGTFNTIIRRADLGVLIPSVTYAPNEVRVTLQAVSLGLAVNSVQGSPTAVSIASALDALRATSYNNLYGLYGAIDVMDPMLLAQTLSGLAPDIASQGHMLGDRQNRMMLNNVMDRLSTLGTMPGGTFSVSTDSSVFAAMSGVPSSTTLGYRSIVASQAGMQTLPEGMTGFMSGRYSLTGSVAGYDRNGVFGAQRSWQFGMGLEMQVADNLTMGTAIGYADGIDRPEAGSRANVRTSQMAVYGAYRLGGGAYVAGVASVDMNRVNLARGVTEGLAPVNLNGATDASRLNVQLEAGVNLAMRGLTLTPRVAVGYSRYHLDGFREQGGEVAFQFDELSSSQLESRVGARLSGQRNFGSGWTIAPQIQADVVRLLSGANTGLSVRFANAPGAAFALPLAGGDATWGEVRGGVRLINGPVEIGVALESTIGRTNYRDGRAVSDFTLRF